MRTSTFFNIFDYFLFLWGQNHPTGPELHCTWCTITQGTNQMYKLRGKKYSGHQHFTWSLFLFSFFFWGGGGKGGMTPREGVILTWSAEYIWLKVQIATLWNIFDQLVTMNIRIKGQWQWSQLIAFVPRIIKYTI